MVYTKIPRLIVDLVHLPTFVDLSSEAKKMADQIIELHKEVQKKSNAQMNLIKKSANKHHHLQQCHIRDLVMIHLRKARFRTRTYNKLKNRKLGPFPITKVYGANTLSYLLIFTSPRVQRC